MAEDFKKSSNVKLKAKHFWTGLALLFGIILCLALLLGPDVNSQDERGRTALLRAAFTTNNARITELLEAGADPNIQDKRGRTALMWAAFDGNNPGVRQLLEAGADPNLKTERGQTALMWAAEQRRTSLSSSERERYSAVMRQLLAAGATR